MSVEELRERVKCAVILSNMPSEPVELSDEQADAASVAVLEALFEAWSESPMKISDESSDDYVLGWGRCREVAHTLLHQIKEDGK